MPNPFADRPAGFWRPAQPPAVHDAHGQHGEHPSPLGSLVWAPGILSRNGVRYLRTRAWRTETRDADLQLLKRAKLELAPAMVAAIADDMHALASEVFGAGLFSAVVPVACGHSRRPNCLSAQLAVQLASRLGCEIVRAFADRFVSGVSHPKEFDRLPPLQLVQRPAGAVLVVDDVATSGWHMHEAITTLRHAGIAAAGLVWASGTKQA